MNRKKRSVRASRMELEFALVGGDPNRIKTAEQELADALEEAAKKGGASESNDDSEPNGLLM